MTRNVKWGSKLNSITIAIRLHNMSRKCIECWQHLDETVNTSYLGYLVDSSKIWWNMTFYCATFKEVRFKEGTSSAWEQRAVSVWPESSLLKCIVSGQLRQGSMVRERWSGLKETLTRQEVAIGADQEFPCCVFRQFSYIYNNSIQKCLVRT